MRKTALLLAVILLAPSPPIVSAQNETSEILPRVIIVTISAIRNEDSIGDATGQYIPYLSKKIFGQGCLYTNLVDLSYQFHMAPVSAIITGLPYRWSNELRAPSIFQYIRKQYNLPPEKIWSIGDWIIDQCVFESDTYPRDTFPCQIASLRFAMSEEARAALDPLLAMPQKQLLKTYAEVSKNAFSTWPAWDSSGDAQFFFLKKIMKHYQPVFVHYVMNDVESAHSGTRGRYLLALKKCDEKINYLWDVIHKDPFYAGKTYLIISPDHPRNAYYKDHNEALFGEASLSSVWLYIYGPDIQAGITIERQIHHEDIFPTLARLYGLQTHEHYGKILDDAFRTEDNRPR